MSDTGSNDPYDPNRPSQPPPPPQQPQWGTNPPAGEPGQPGQPGQYGQPGQPGGEWSGGQLGGQQFGAPQYGGQYGQPAGSPPPNYLVWSILSTILCCLPLGIVSIVYAAQVNGKFASGDFAGAQESSRKAKQFAIWSAAIGLVVAVLYIVGIVIVAGASST